MRSHAGAWERENKCSHIGVPTEDHGNEKIKKPANKKSRTVTSAASLLNGR